MTALQTLKQIHLAINHSYFIIVSTTFPVKSLEFTHDIGQTHTISCGCLLDADFTGMTA